MEINEKISKVIQNAYSWLDHDGDGVVSILDLKKSCKILTDEEASELFNSLKSTDSEITDIVTYQEFFLGVTEFPGLLTRFVHEESTDKSDQSINFESDIGERLWTAIRVVSEIANCYQDHCNFYTNEELVEILSQTAKVVKMKYKKNAELKKFASGLLKLCEAIKALWANHVAEMEKLQKKNVEYQINWANTNKKYEDCVEKNEKLLEKLIGLEKAYNESVKELEKTRRANSEITQKKSTEESEELSNISNQVKSLQAIKQKIKHYFTLNMCKDSQSLEKSDKITQPIFKKKQPYPQEKFLAQLKKKENIIKEKDEEIRFTLDLISSLRSEIEALKEENKSLILQKNTEKFKERKEYFSSDSDLNSFQEISEISYIEPTDFCFMLKPHHRHKDSETQTGSSLVKSRNSCLWFF